MKTIMVMKRFVLNKSNIFPNINIVIIFPNRRTYLAHEKLKHFYKVSWLK